MRHGFISFSKLDRPCYSYSFGDGLFQLIFLSCIIGTCLNGGLYRFLSAYVSFQTELIVIVQNLLMYYSIKDLGHISQERLKETHAR